MNNQNNISNNFGTKVIIKLKLLEIFPLKEEIKNILSDCSLKFEETNNNKYNVYNLFYLLNKTVILIPTSKKKNLTRINMVLIKDNDMIISKGILYINENRNESIVKFDIMNKYINIKFHYNLNAVNLIDENKTKRKESNYKTNTVNTSKKKNVQKIKGNEKINYTFMNNTSNIKHDDNTKIKIIKKNKNHCHFSNTDRKNNIHFNVNKSQIFFPCNILINNKDNNDNKINYSEIWINDTKLFIKKIKNYISLRNSRNDSQKKFKKCFSAKNTHPHKEFSNKFTNSISSKKRSINNINSYSSNSSIDTQKLNKGFFINEISNTKSVNTNTKLNHSANNIKDNSNSNNKNYKYSTSTSKNYINNNSIQEVKNTLFKNFEENIKNKNYNEKNEESDLNMDYYNIENNKDINKYKINNNLYKRKIIRNIYEKKNDLFPINNINSKINPRKNQSNENISLENNQNGGKDKVYKKQPSIKYLNQIERNNNDIISSFNEFYQLKNDLYLLYNQKYINSLKNEVIKLEMELFIEKFIELLKEYYKNIDEEKIIYKYLLNTYKNNKKHYNIYNNLIKKLNDVKEKNEQKLVKININNKDLLIIKNEVSIFELLLKNNRLEVEKENNFEIINNKIVSKMLKNILIKILNNKYYQEILYKIERYKTWIEKNIIPNELIHYNEVVFEKENTKKIKKINFN